MLFRHETLSDLYCSSNVEKQSGTMDHYYFINMVFILVVNILFFFSGICLNSLVILSFWRSVRLRRKLCYFTIMVLSCCDLLVVLFGHPLLVLTATLRMTGTLDLYNPPWLHMCSRLTTFLLGVSLFALLVMNFDRYLATSYPIFHRTSVTTGRLLTLFALLVSFNATLVMLSLSNRVISYTSFLTVSFLTFFLPMIFINYKLFAVVWAIRRNNRTLSVQNVSSCLMAVGCFAVLSIPVLVVIGQRVASNEKTSYLEVSALWSRTVISMNSTFNCFIFYWKNKTLRTEGIKVIHTLKMRGRVQP